MLQPLPVKQPMVRNTNTEDQSLILRSGYIEEKDGEEGEEEEDEDEEEEAFVEYKNKMKSPLQDKIRI